MQVKCDKIDEIVVFFSKMFGYIFIYRVFARNFNKLIIRQLATRKTMGVVVKVTIIYYSVNQLLRQPQTNNTNFFCFKFALKKSQYFVVTTFLEAFWDFYIPVMATVGGVSAIKIKKLCVLFCIALDLYYRCLWRK